MLFVRHGTFMLRQPHIGPDRSIRIMSSRDSRETTVRYRYQRADRTRGLSTRSFRRELKRRSAASRCSQLHFISTSYHPEFKDNILTFFAAAFGHVAFVHFRPADFGTSPFLVLAAFDKGAKLSRIRGQGSRVGNASGTGSNGGIIKPEENPRCKPRGDRV